MKQIGPALGRAVAKASGVKVPTGSDQLTQEQRSAVGYFFARLKMISSQQYDLLMPDSKTEAVVKREYAPHLADFSQVQIDRGLDAFHRYRQDGDPDYKYLDLDRIIGLIRHGGSKPGECRAAGIYKVIPPGRRVESDELKSKRRRAAEQGLAELRDLLNS